MQKYRRFASHPNTPEDYQRAKELRQTASPAERVMWYELRLAAKGKDFDFRRQYPIHPYFPDFACIKFRLLIEIDGNSHDTRLAYDKKRDDYLKDLGYEIMRFTNEDVLKNRHGVIETIMDRILEMAYLASPLPNPSPRGGEIKRLE